MQYYCSEDSDHTKENQFQFLRSIADGANLGSKKKGLLMVNILEKKEPDEGTIQRRAAIHIIYYMQQIFPPPDLNAKFDFVRHSKGEDQALLDTRSGNHDFLVSAPCLVYNNLQNEKSIIMPMSMVTAQSQISLVGIIYKLCKQSSALSSSWYKTVYIGSKTLDTFSSMVKLLFLQMKNENKRRRGEKKGNNGGLAGRGRSGMAGASEGTLDGDKIGPSN
ncbi:hypothetical protein NC653_033212 [Populus alba x Populus x berolinensis]|uniref:Uncharacterized protein n=1 Tax=Populus alba x Populus x berolinensis TaxID=444605 RepID=A0AAD6LT45_9ROSI|nr:hypothetical protein NC653_033212 [Populus alba x Populus x berolinensis]